MEWKRISPLVMIVAIALMVVAGCDQNTGVPHTGSLTIALQTDRSGMSRNIDPSGTDPLVISSFTLSGTGPENQTLGTVTTSDTTITLDNLLLGDWTFTATAYNTDGVALVQGTVNTHVTDTDHTVEISLEGTMGLGSFSLVCDWNVAQTSEFTTIDMKLIDGSGNEVAGLTTAEDYVNGSATLTGTNIPAGFYTAIATLKTKEELIGGFAESVRIIDGTLSSASRTIDIGHMVDGATITIVDNTTAPVEGTIAVTPATLAVGDPATLTYTLDAGQDVVMEDLTIQWYCDGVPIDGATQPVYSITEVLGGTYRYDVIASLPESGSVGSCGVEISVEVTPQQVIVQ
jgi:hypothetical protein